MLLRGFFRSSVRATLVFYTVLVALTGLTWWLGAFRPALSGLAYTLTWPIIAGMLAGATIAFLKMPTLRQVATAVDVLGGTRDRLVTALDFSEKERASGMEALALRESAGFVQGRDFRPLLPMRVPWELRWLAVPLLALGIMWWDGLRAVAEQDQRVAVAKAQSSGTVKQLETLADQLRNRAPEDQLTRELAERLKQAAMQVRAEASEGHDGQKAALRELALLEQLVQELRRPGAPTPDELKALAGALAADEKLKDAAKDLQQGNFPEAAKKLAEAAKDQPTAEHAQKVIQEALEHLAKQKEQLSRQLEGMRQLAAEGGENSEHQQLLQQLSELLGEMQQNGQLKQTPQQGGKSGPQPGAGKPMTDNDLKRLLGALQQMKDEQQGEGGQQAPAEGEGDGKGSASSIAVQNFSDQDRSGEAKDNNPGMPSGKPGTDRDKGTTESPFGKQGEAADKGQSEQLTGKLAEGESLSTLVPSAAKGDAKAALRYKQLTEAAAADAADAVTQENIPLGSRFLIRRYFEALRARQP